MSVLSSKWMIYLLALVVGSIVGGCYGALHNQISYSVSSEYFTLFKFKQFNLPWAYEQPRLGAAWVGVMASWWMGLLLAAVLGLVGLRSKDTARMARLLAQSFTLVLVTALAVGLWGLWSAQRAVTLATIDDYRAWVVSGALDPVAFVQAGFMHNASYTGGVAGLAVGVVYLWWRTRKPNSLI